jgi:phosphoglycerate dehydrogenase-like enzyme
LKTAERDKSPRQGSKIFLGPEKEEIFIRAIESSGCVLTESMEHADGIVWFGRDPVALESAVTANIKWLQIPDAGAEKWINSEILRRNLTITCASGIYGPQVAEHALALILGCYRQLGFFSQQSHWNPTGAPVHSLAGKKALVLGGGGIGVGVAEMLKPLKCEVTVMSKSGRRIESADHSLPFSDFHSEVSRFDVIVLAAPATPETYQIINAESLALLAPNALIINVARGSLIDSDALLDALDRGAIFGAGLDVTDPEPLPEGHRFFDHPKVLLTPHVANPPALKKAAFARHVAENCRRFFNGDELLAVIDLDRGY